MPPGSIQARLVEGSGTVLPAPGKADRFKRATRKRIARRGSYWPRYDRGVLIIMVSRNLQPGRTGRTAGRDGERAGTAGEATRAGAPGQEFYRVVRDDGMVLEPCRSRTFADGYAETYNRESGPGEPHVFVERVSDRALGALLGDG